MSILEEVKLYAWERRVCKKGDAQKEITSSWTNTINNTLKYLSKGNLSKEQIEIEILDIWEDAIQWASEEVYGGIDIEGLNKLIDKERIVRFCILLILTQREKQKMHSHLSRLVEHVIKIHAQHELRLGWENTIRNCLKYINQLKDSKTNFEVEIELVWEDSISYAALEIKGGCSEEVLESLIDKRLVVLHCLSLLLL